MPEHGHHGHGGDVYKRQVFYHRTTDENGMASLHIRLNPGKYIITSIWNEYQIGNNITIA